MQWWENYYADVDSKDIKRVEAWFTEDIVLQFGNTPEILGREQAIAALGGFTAGLSSLSHCCGRAIENGNEMFMDAAVTYTLPDGRTVCIPAATYKKRRGEKICELRVYADFSPLYG